MIACRSAAEGRDRHLCVRTLHFIPRHLFQVSILPAIGGIRIALGTIAAAGHDHDS